MLYGSGMAYKATEKTHISLEDYYRLVGLLTVAKQHNEALAVISRAAAEITGEQDDGYGYYGVTSDFIGGDGMYSADALLKQIEISVDD